jgi:uncharacterized protein (DUF2384 family)
MKEKKVERLNECLMSLLGSEELVEKWWLSKNKGFDMKTPQEVWDSGEEGKELVIHYLLFFLTR